MSRRLLLLLPLIASSACFQGERLIKVNPDGSGTIVDSLVLGAQMRALANLPKADTGTKTQEAAAAAMGPGVRFVSEDKIPDGLRTTYAFKDIGALSLDAAPGPDTKDKGTGSAPQPLKFRFTRAGSRSTLTIVQPSPQKSPATAQPPDGTPDLAQGIWVMMRGFLKGLKLKTSVEVAGKVVHTNSQLVEGSTITLLEMDFDEIVADDANFKKFTAAGGDPSELDPKLLQGVQGIKVNPVREVVVEFTK